MGGACVSHANHRKKPLADENNTAETEVNWNECMAQQSLKPRD